MACRFLRVAALATLESGNLLVSEGGLNGQYAVAQFHFHWGSDDNRGSEHAVNGEQFPMEVGHTLTSAAENSLGLRMLSTGNIFPGK